MSAKNLLNENTIRRFMKLANVDSLTNNFIAESYAIEEEDEMTDDAITEVEEEEESRELLQGEEEPMEEEPMDDEMDDEPMEDEPMEDELGEADISLTEEEAQLLIDLGDRLRDALGAEGDEDMDLDMDEPDMDEPAMDEPDMDEMPPEEEEEEVLQEALVAEVLKRVTRRIIREKKENK
jgi:hypothetical protein